MDGINRNIAGRMHDTVEFMDSIADLHLGSNSMSEWLQRLASFARSKAACAISWTAGEPHTAIFEYSAEPMNFDAAWVASAEALIASAAPDKPRLLDLIARDAGLAGTVEKLDDPRLMIAYLDGMPARTLLVMRCDDRPGGWDEDDRERFSLILPVLLKAHLLHKKYIITGNFLDAANQVLNATPRGIVLITPEAKLIKANAMAHEMMLKNNGLRLGPSGQFSIDDTKVDAQLNAKLTLLGKLPREELGDQIWNRSFRKSKGPGSYQITLRMLAIEDWHLESNKFDRHACIWVSSPETATKPTVELLQTFYDLTTGQARVVSSLMDGHDIVTTAVRLHISVNTLRSHLRAIYAKLGVENIGGLLRMVSATLVNYAPESEKLKR